MGDVPQLFYSFKKRETTCVFLSWLAALTLSIGLASAQQAEADGFRARTQLIPSTSGAGVNPVEFYSLDMPLYLRLMNLGLDEEEAFALSCGEGWDWDEDIVSGSWEWDKDFNPLSWNWDEEFIEKAHPNDSPGP